MLATDLSEFIGSSQYHAIANDTLKDEDNAIWLLDLELEVRHLWLEKISWIRLVDRLAEHDLLNSHSKEFQIFYSGWRLLYQEHKVDQTNPYQETLNQIEQRWFKTFSPLSIRAWNKYIEAINYYHQPALVIETLNQYEIMLKNLSGSFFQVFPYLLKQHYQSIYYLGVLDQFFNNLRDIYEDSQQGICYFPRQLLIKYGITLEEIYNHRLLKNSGYYHMMQFLLDCYLPKLYYQARSFIKAEDLHPSLQKMKQWSLHRYNRIEQVLRDCDFNYILFYQVYWAKVQKELDQNPRQKLSY